MSQLLLLWLPVLLDLPVAPPATTTSCLTSSDPTLTPERLAAQMQGDDAFPSHLAGLPGVVPSLIRLSTDPSNLLVRYRAVTLLGMAGCTEAAPHLETLTSDRDPLVRMYAGIALGDLVGVAATPTLVRLLDDPDRTGVQKFAVKTLGQVGDRRAISPLRRFRARAGTAPWLRALATDAIASIRVRGRPS